MWSFLRHRRRRRLRAEPLLPAWRELLQAQVPAYKRLAPRQRTRHETCVKVLVAEQTWEGCEGLAVSEEMKVTIAGHAAVMLLGAGEYYFDSVTTVLVFPDVIERTSDGVVTHNVGEAWDSGSVIVSWSEVELARREDGRNIVIHEFAHHLDGRDGEMGGSIPFRDRPTQLRWEEVASREFDQHVAAVASGTRTLLDAYGATNRAEFFAVCSEAFFERPHRLCKRHPDLHELLTKFYQLDPRDWQPDEPSP